jgi:hypothetical protein
VCFNRSGSVEMSSIVDMRRLIKDSCSSSAAAALACLQAMWQPPLHLQKYLPLEGGGVCRWQVLQVSPGHKVGVQGIEASEHRESGVTGRSCWLDALERAGRGLPRVVGAVGGGRHGLGARVTRHEDTPSPLTPSVWRVPPTHPGRRATNRVAWRSASPR